MGKRTRKKPKNLRPSFKARQRAERYAAKKLDAPPGFYSGGHQHLTWVKPREPFSPLTQWHEKAYWRIPRVGSVKSIYTEEIQRTFALDRIYQVRLREGQAIPATFDEYLWHGTRESAVSAIGHESLKPSRDGLLGSGVYVTPDISKAFNYTGRSRGWSSWMRMNWQLQQVGTLKDWAFLFLCGVRLVPDQFDFAERGANPAAWSGRLVHSEYVIRDPEHVAPLFLCVYHVQHARRAK